MDDVIINKAAIIERCILRIHEVYDNDPSNLDDITKQDSIILNIQRACEAAIDLAMHIIAENSWGVPQLSREAFDFLLARDVIDEELNRRLKAMVGFRNIAVHDYQKLDMGILQQVIDNHLDDLMAFSQKLLSCFRN